MTTLMQIEQSLRRIELNMFPHLHPDDLSEHSVVAEELGFGPAALADILAGEIGPELRPVLNTGCYWFERCRLFLGW
jgi:hypothetical protein